MVAVIPAARAVPGYHVKILDDAGWEKGSDGIRAKDGVKLSVTYPIFSDDPTQAALAQSMQKSENSTELIRGLPLRSM